MFENWRVISWKTEASGSGWRRYRVEILHQWFECYDYKDLFRRPYVLTPEDWITGMARKLHEYQTVWLQRWEVFVKRYLEEWDVPQDPPEDPEGGSSGSPGGDTSTHTTTTPGGGPPIPGVEDEDGNPFPREESRLSSPACARGRVFCAVGGWDDRSGVAKRNVEPAAKSSNSVHARGGRNGPARSIIW